MSTVSLEEFVKPFSEALGRTNPPKTVEEIDTDGSVQFILADSLSEAQVVEKFIAEATKIGVQIERTTTNQLGASIVTVAKKMEGTTVLFPDCPEADECNLEQILQDSGFAPTRWNAQNGHDEITEAATKDIGITFAFGGIAETGSVIQLTSSGSGRSIGTIPPSHIAIVPKSKVFARMGYALDAIKKESSEIPSNITVISGPSATADIELVRVVGVHGPVHTAIILVEDK